MFLNLSASSNDLRRPLPVQFGGVFGLSTQTKVLPSGEDRARSNAYGSPHPDCGEPHLTPSFSAPWHTHLGAPRAEVTQLPSARDSGVSATDAEFPVEG